MKAILIYGAGGMGKVAVDCALTAGFYCKGIFDDAVSAEEIKSDILFLGTYQPNRYPAMPLVVAVGDNRTRQILVHKVKHAFIALAHGSAQISNTTHIGTGIIVGPQAVINSGVAVGHHTLINTGAIVEHDCRIEPYAHIAPGAILCGETTVGEGTLIGAGAVVLPGVKIGCWCIIGAGAVVTQNIPDHSVAYGSPAKIIRREIIT